MSDDRLSEMTRSIHGGVEAKMHQLEAQCDSLKLDKSILERQIADLQATLFENRTDENSQVDNQVKILSEQIQDARAQKELLLLQHAQDSIALKSATDKRISEMIKSHATSILSMQERVVADITATWQQKLQEEQAVSAELRATVQTLSAQLAALAEEKQQAVRDTKKKMYDKVTLQFEAGNVKYDALKSSYKESQDQLQTASSTIQELRASLSSAQGQLELSREQAAHTAASLGQVEAGLAELVSSFSAQPLDSSSGSSTEVLAAIQQELTSKTARVEEAATLSAELNAEIVRLKESILLTNTNISAINAEKDALNLSLSAAKDALEAAQQQLASSTQERDSQMLVIANMITDKGRLDSELEKAALQTQELTQRCADLRRMNDEVMCMLEKMYAEKA
jgi:chromosome segregation ATPase